MLFSLMLARNGGGGGDATAPHQTRPVTWVDKVWTRPVPSWGAPIRIGLPVQLNSTMFGRNGGLGTFGSNEGGHVEGLNPVWISIAPGSIVGSRASGNATKINGVSSVLTAATESPAQTQLNVSVRMIL